MNNVLSTTTKRLCKCIVPSGSTYVNDYSFNVVYFITSNKCKHLKILTKDSIDRNSTAIILILAKVIAKTLHILSILLKALRDQDVQIGMLWILQLDQFERLKLYDA